MGTHMYFADEDLFKNFQIERWKVHETNILAFRQSGPRGKAVDQSYISVSKCHLVKAATITNT